MEELLTVVQAEETADAVIRDAQRRAEDLIAGLMRERELLLANTRPPVLRPVSLPPLDPGLDRLRSAAKRNMRKAVQRILEELDAAA